MYVSLKEHLIIACGYDYQPASRLDTIKIDPAGSKGYTPKLYPGRVTKGRGGGVYLHVMDKRGKLN